MDRNTILANPEKYDKSMLNHPDPSPARMKVWHPTEAPSGVILPWQEGQNLLESNKGWVDSKRKIGQTGETVTGMGTLQDIEGTEDQRKKDLVVEQAVAAELGDRKDNAPGRWPEAIKAPAWSKLNKADIIDFLYYHQLSDTVDDSMSAKDLLSMAKDLHAKHNEIIGKRERLEEAKNAEPPTPEE